MSEQVNRASLWKQEFDRVVDSNPCDAIEAADELLREFDKRFGGAKPALVAAPVAPDHLGMHPIVYERGYIRLLNPNRNQCCFDVPADVLRAILAKCDPA